MVNVKPLRYSKMISVLVTPDTAELIERMASEPEPSRSKGDVVREALDLGLGQMVAADSHSIDA